MLLYSIKNLEKYHQKRCILSLPSLNIKPHKIYALAGPNGAGKTSLMRLLAFLDLPQKGELSYLGNKVDKKNIRSLRKNTVLLTQSPVMFSGTVGYNVAYPLMLQQYPTSVIKQKVPELLKMVGLAHLEKANAQRLSGGETQRVSLARALASKAKVLLLDEPTASMDQASSKLFLSLMKKIWATGEYSILFSSHDFHMSENLCHKYIYLVDGRCVPESQYLFGQVYHQVFIERTPQASLWHITFCDQALAHQYETHMPLRIEGLYQRKNNIYYICLSETGEKINLFTQPAEDTQKKEEHKKEQEQTDKKASPHLGDIFSLG